MNISFRSLENKCFHVEMFTSCIYKLLWHLLHSLVSLYEYCLWLRLRLIAFALWSYDLCRRMSATEQEQKDYDFLQQCKKHLNKIPKHLNLIIGPENTQATDKLLTQIISYALHMNINCISYYDTRYANTTGSSKCSLTALEKLKCPTGWTSKNIDAHHSLWYREKINNGVSAKHANGVTNSNLINGHLSKTTLSVENSSIEIYEIQPQHNRPLLAQVCRDLFKQRHTTEIKKLLEERSLLMEHIDQEISKHLGCLTEPELSIIFDDSLCMFGMLPWHTRFTEFHRHAKGQVFNVKTFAHILYKYSRSEQRWGK